MSRNAARDFGIATAATLVAAAAWEFWQRSEKAAAKAAPAGPALPGPALATPNERLRQVVLGLLPNDKSTLAPPDDTWNAILGGKRPDSFGGPAWRYFAMFIGQNPDGTKRKGGTTCGIFAAACAAKAGWDVSLINRATDDTWAPGSGFTPGAHIYKLLGAAKKRGWVVDFKPPAPLVAGAAELPPLVACRHCGSALGQVRVRPAPIGAMIDSVEIGEAESPWWEPKCLGCGGSHPLAAPGAFELGAAPGSSNGFTLLRGDYFYQDRKGAMYDGKPVDGGHVGIVADVGEPDAQGVRLISTVDGGFTNAAGQQSARWNQRKFFPDGRLVLLPYMIEAKLVSVVRPT